MPIEKCFCGWWGAAWKEWEAKEMFKYHLKYCPFMNPRAINSKSDMPDSIEDYYNEKAEARP